jgi:outer membrane receptor protein involved in Fe transport
VGFSQDLSTYITGSVSSKSGQKLPGIYLKLEGTNIITTTDVEGNFKIVTRANGEETITISGIGFVKYTKTIHLEKNKNLEIDFILEEDSQQLQEVVVSGKTEARTLLEKGFNLQAIETKKLQNQNIELNKILDRSAGVRVKQSGGMGSDFAYSLDGMSGNSIRFLIDGIPVDLFGSVYNINNFPISLTERVEVYKGVVPVYLASDALGGAVNLITLNRPKDFFESSYSIGSFNSHRAVIHGQLSNIKSGLTARLSTFYNYSTNAYKVWGKTVTYYDESTDFRPVEFTKKNPATRFNDDYQAACFKAEVGFTEKKWADQVFIGVLTSDVNRGVQHGQTMAYIYGDMRYKERFYMPNFKFIKNDVFVKNLDVKLYSSYAITNGITIDTSIYNYNWRGDIVSIDLDGGERRAQKSLFKLQDRAFITSLNSSYKINDHYELVLNLLIKDVKRTGSDEFAPYHTIPFTKPQTLFNSFTGISLNSNFFNDKLKTDVFVKHFGYKAGISQENTTTDPNDENVITISSKLNNMGSGLASSLKFGATGLIKFSVENTVRLPDTREALGNGVNILNSPDLKPEKSTNFNLSIDHSINLKNSKNNLKFTLSTFYRNTVDLIYPTISGGRGEIRYENISKILGKGVELELSYKNGSILEINYNASYLDFRNNEIESKQGVKNAVYWDRLRNAPYFLSNITTLFRKENLFQKKSITLFYCQAGYVHQYYLGWPSLGSSGSKSIIPTQFVVDIGIGYTFPKQSLTVGLDASNILNSQLYDNFLLQKPGRAISLKLNYRITKS